MLSKDKPCKAARGNLESTMMHKSKKDRFRKKGWRIGTVEDFLHLTAEEAAYVELRLRLSNSLRKYRNSRKLSQVQLARLIKSSQSRVAKMEGGDPSVSLDLLIRSLLTLGASQQDLAKTISSPMRAAT